MYSTDDPRYYTEPNEGYDVLSASTITINQSAPTIKQSDTVIIQPTPTIKYYWDISGSKTGYDRILIGQHTKPNRIQRFLISKLFGWCWVEKT